MEKLLSIEEYFDTLGSYTKRGSIAHYKRMIQWAKTRPKTEFADRNVMQMELGEWWGSTYCCHCTHYGYTGWVGGESCQKCPLFDDGDCCDGLHAKLHGDVKWGYVD